MIHQFNFLYHRRMAIITSLKNFKRLFSNQFKFYKLL